MGALLSCCGLSSSSSSTTAAAESSPQAGDKKKGRQMATTASYSTAITSAITKLKEVGINFLALDFDQTILDIHTGGRWKGTVEELYPRIRPVFAQLIQAAQEHDIQVAVVTFSAQTKFVRGVLDHIVGTEAAQQIPIRGGDRSWQYKGGGSHDGKQPHMASAVEELETRFEVKISKRTTLLIDDDGRNIEHALRDGTCAIWFNPSKPHLLLQDIIKFE